MKKFEDAELEILELDERDIVLTSDTAGSGGTGTGGDVDPDDDIYN